MHVAGYIADIKAMSDVHGGTNRVRSLTYRMTFDPKKSDPAMMNDQTRFQMSIFADVSQVLLLSQFNYCIGCVRLSDLAMQVLSSLSLVINIFNCRHLQKFSRRQTGRRRRRKSASKTCHRRTVLSKSSTALRRHATVQRPWFWRMRSPDK